MNGLTVICIMHKYRLTSRSGKFPVAFLIIRHYMHRSSEKLNFVHFADDTTVYMSGYDLNQLCEEVSIELGKVEEWMRANRLSLNVQKTSFMVFTDRPIKREDLVIEIGGMRVQNVRVAKFLGVTVDDRLSYNQHVSELSKKLSCSIGLMYRVYNCVPQFVIKTAFQFILPALNLRHDCLGRRRYLKLS